MCDDQTVQRFIEQGHLGREGERPHEPKLLGWLLAYRKSGQQKVKKW